MSESSHMLTKESTYILHVCYVRTHQVAEKSTYTLQRNMSPCQNLFSCKLAVLTNYQRQVLVRINSVAKEINLHPTKDMSDSIQSPEEHLLTNYQEYDHVEPVQPQEGFTYNLLRTCPYQSNASKGTYSQTTTDSEPIQLQKRLTYTLPLTCLIWLQASRGKIYSHATKKKSPFSCKMAGESTHILPRRCPCQLQASKAIHSQPIGNITCLATR